MKVEIKRLWVVALRSGEYTQSQHSLITYVPPDDASIHDILDEETLKNASYCCLGVLCDLYRKETGKNLWSDAAFDGTRGLLAPSVMEWAGLTEENPVIKIDKRSTVLAELNDVLDFNFEQIADVIEKQL